MEVIVIDARKVPMILKLKSRLPTVKKLIIMDAEVSEEVQNNLKDAEFDFTFMEILQSEGAKMDFKPNPPSPSDLCTISYTSGTTGHPKGAMLTHSALIAAAASALYIVGANPKYPNAHGSYSLLPGEETYLSFLPLAHILERLCVTSLTSLGCRFAFFQGDILKLLDDLEASQPTFFAGVPRLFNRIYDKVIAGIAAKGFISKFLFDYALSTKKQNYHSSGVLTHWLWDRIIFNKVKAKMGGKVKVILTGSAPLAPQIFEFLRAAFSCPVLEGYGATETCGVICSVH